MKKMVSLCLGLVLMFGVSTNAFAKDDNSANIMHRVANSEISFGLVEKEGIIPRQSYTRFSVAETEFGMEGNIEINSKMAENVYRIAFDMPTGNYLTLPTGENKDGSVLIVDENGNLTGAVDPLQVCDANGIKMPVNVDVENNIITYALDDLNRSIEYPLTGNIAVYADAHSFSTWFQNGWWEMRSGWKTLSLVPTSGWHSFDATTAQISWSWGTVKTKFSGHSWWTNETGLNDQYYCHVMGSSQISDNEWNLEPERPSVGTSATLSANCNP